MKPFYDLTAIKVLIQQERYLIIGSARQSAFWLGCNEDHICECIVEYLEETHLHKSMPSEKNPGLMQDVYKIMYAGMRIYLKLQISFLGDAVVISFKEDESYGD